MSGADPLSPQSASHENASKRENARKRGESRADAVPDGADPMGSTPRIVFASRLSQVGNAWTVRRAEFPFAAISLSHGSLIVGAEIHPI
jgi:hypothetical protein